MSLETLLAGQAGVIAREQALAAGLSRDAIDSMVRTRHWRPLHPRVYLADGYPPGDEARVRAAVLWAGPDAVLAGLGAAWWHGMIAAPPPALTVDVGRRRHPRGRPGVSVRRRRLDAVDVTVRRGLAVTGAPRTVLDAAVQLGDRGGPLLDRALRRWVPFPDLYAAYCRQLGAPGSASAHRLLVAAADRSSIVAERELVALLRRSGTLGWRRGTAIGDDRIAVTFPASGLVVETSGWAWHVDGVRARADRRRFDALTARGWRVLRPSWHDLVTRPDAVLDAIARARSAPVPGPPAHRAAPCAPGRGPAPPAARPARRRRTGGTDPRERVVLDVISLTDGDRDRPPTARSRRCTAGREGQGNRRPATPGYPES